MKVVSRQRDNLQSSELTEFRLTHVFQNNFF